MNEKNKDLRKSGIPTLETPDAMYREARTKIELEAYSEAVHLLERLLVIYPKFGVAHNDLGVLYYNQGNMKMSFFPLSGSGTY